MLLLGNSGAHRLQRVSRTGILESV